MPDFEKLGSFYLGRKHDLAADDTLDLPTLYDSKDLTTHAVCVGMTGSGKTGLCISLIEEACLDGIPVIAIDPKGDLGNLLLAFPDLQPSYFRPWIDPSMTARKGLSPDEFAAETAELWREGLAQWGQDGNRIRKFNESVEQAIYTPGSNAGIPLTVLKSFNAPPQAVLDDADSYRDRVQTTTSGVLGLLGIEADPVRSREHILISNVLDHTWREGNDLDLPGLIQAIQTPPFAKVGVVDLETFYPAKERLELGMLINNLLASPTFSSWLEGDSLDVQRLLYTAEGRPRLSILSIAHLNDAERMFFVTILLNEILSWIRTQPGTGSLRAILYMDEVYGYFPPIATPPSKKPMLTLLKQARAFGLGVVLATQNPVDLDYKGLSNAGTWFLGRLQTERDKRRVLEGLEGASVQAGATFNRQRMEATLAALGSRVFLMNNVHENHPVVFHTRWAMSYLAGPLTRDQIHILMADRKADWKAERLTPDSAKPQAAEILAQMVARPVVSAEIVQRFMQPTEDVHDGETLIYKPGLYSTAKLHFVDSTCGVDAWRNLTVVQTLHGELPTSVWDSALAFQRNFHIEEQPLVSAGFAELPSPLAQEKNYRGWDDDLKDHLYREEKLTVWRCEEFADCSQPGESEAEYRIRITQLAREKRDGAKDAIREKYKNRLERAQAAVEKAESYLREQRSQFWSRVAGAIWSVAEFALNKFAGGSRRRISTSSARQAMRERGQQSRAQQRLDDKLTDLEELEEQLQSEMEQIDIDFEPKNLRLKKVDITPRKSDIAVEPIQLVWLPWNREQNTPAW